jgi:hypothetical protein
VSCLRHSTTTPEQADSYGSEWAPPVADDASYVRLGLCKDQFPSEDLREELDYIPFDPGDPKGLELRQAFYLWIRV